MNKCSKRPYSCDYCNDYESTCEDVTTNHWPVCPRRPVPCTNQCGVYPEQQNLDYHVDKECPLTVIDCSFGYAGCMERLQREDMDDHFAKNLHKHMSLQANSHQQAMHSLKSENSELKKLIQELERKVKEQEIKFDIRFTQLQEEKLALEEQLKKLGAQMNEQQQQQTEDIRLQIEPLNQLTTALEQQLKTSTVHEIEMNSHISVAPLDVILKGFSMLKQSKKRWFSKAFYSHYQGYRLCLCIYANGSGEGKRTHASIYMYLMKGDFDDALKWPMRGILNIQLFGRDESWHDLCTIPFVDEVFDKVFGRLRFADASSISRGWGCAKVIDHASLDANFLINDCLHLRICRLEIV